MSKYIYVPYSDKDEAKRLGAKWDKNASSWYIPDGVSEVPFSKWIETRDPSVRFAEDLIAHGCLLRQDEPKCDGQTHRVKVEGDKGNEQSGFYVMHLDGVPNGYFMNNRTKDSFKNLYLNRGADERVSPEEIKRRQEEYKAKQALAEQERQKLERQVATNIRYQLKKFCNTNEITSPYFVTKRIPGSLFTFAEESKDGAVTWIPLYDVKKQLTTAQTISPEGEKRFVKGGKKHGSFHVVLGKIEPEDSTVIICEGYATAASIQYSLSEHKNVKVVAAIDAGNLLPVAQSLKKRYSDKHFIIACDNDRAGERNVGVDEGKKAAEAIGCKAVIPQFSDGDEGTDFNDLMLSAGKDAVLKSFLTELLV